MMFLFPGISTIIHLLVILSKKIGDACFRAGNRLLEFWESAFRTRKTISLTIALASITFVGFSTSALVMMSLNQKTTNAQVLTSFMCRAGRCDQLFGTATVYHPGTHAATADQTLPANLPPYSH